MKLSRTERWILANQYRILEALYPAEGDSLRSRREVLEAGYELEYSWICEGIYPDDQTMSEDECREVLEMMNMFSFLKYGAEQAGPELASADVTFPGFDGNNETKQLGYAQHLRSQGKFLDLDEGDHLNSHMPVLDQYRRMLVAWGEAADKHNLTAADIARILAARIHPANR